MRGWARRSFGGSTTPPASKGQKTCLIIVFVTLEQYLTSFLSVIVFDKTPVDGFVTFGDPHQKR